MATLKKREFSGFSLAEALALTEVERFQPWAIPAQDRLASSFFHERQNRLKIFDTFLSESAKQLLIELIFEEVGLPYQNLKIFKGVALNGREIGGFVDYLIAPNRVLPGTPLLCVVEAKKDNFEKGMAQCLVEMHVCAEKNQDAGQELDTYGIVSNGSGWQFYKRDTQNIYWQSEGYGVQPLEPVLGAVDYVLARCLENAEKAAKIGG
ncbi:hypothetical protein [Armatimonas sp.]|uniref:hypothetical protein n=1 Tax=Armatimonas sp. TaxID=1872638 RepID=UPI0037523EEC